MGLKDRDSLAPARDDGSRQCGPRYMIHPLMMIRVPARPLSGPPGQGAEAEERYEDGEHPAGIYHLSSVCLTFGLPCIHKRLLARKGSRLVADGL